MKKNVKKNINRNQTNYNRSEGNGLERKLDENYPLYEQLHPLKGNEESVVLICNKCGHNAIPMLMEHMTYEQNMMHAFKAYFGYGSNYDFERWEFHLCESCLMEFIKTFQFAPKGFGVDAGYEEDPEAQEQFDQWKNKKTDE